MKCTYTRIRRQGFNQISNLIADREEGYEGMSIRYDGSDLFGEVSIDFGIMGTDRKKRTFKEISEILANNLF